MESFFNGLKNERVFHEDDVTREQVRKDLFDYIEVFYNQRRRHSALGYSSPRNIMLAGLPSKI
jgi:putative transposase